MADKTKESKKDDTTKDANATGDTEPKRSRVADLLFLDDDDDFEEFPQEDWGKADENKDDEKATAWSEKWDDDELEDEFSKKLQAELEKMKTTPKAPAGTVPMSH
ncbi:26S proteasome complex subunit SEM1-like [Paramacrobiotus metropolitanus]|uniref:26S proteasome complex subunit SEM1-like n=1 Tax=Paramacrobiotus metropolitanus TaxID=2943436 RepID=UPI002445E24E|nr:26S proteasome complex subunit SEM1-like [Paramacrobiotus metropolitanus]